MPKSPSKRFTYASPSLAPQNLELHPSFFPIFIADIAYFTSYGEFKPPKKDANPQAARLGTGDVTTASKQLDPSRCASWARFAVRVWFAVPSMAFPRNTQKFRQLFHLDLRLFSTVGSETVIGHVYKHSDYG
jgi:hypothetical protein